MYVITEVFSPIPEHLNVPFFGLGDVALAVKVASSKARHLKSFLYPPQSTPRLWHCWHVGFVSSHFSLFALHVTQPVDRVIIHARNVCGGLEQDRVE